MVATVPVREWDRDGMAINRVGTVTPVRYLYDTLPQRLSKKSRVEKGEGRCS